MVWQLYSPLLAQSMTESEIAKILEVDQSTISRDIKVLKKLSQQFVYDLAKSDLAYLLQAMSCQSILHP